MITINKIGHANVYLVRMLPCVDEADASGIEALLKFLDEKQGAPRIPFILEVHLAVSIVLPEATRIKVCHHHP